MGFLLTPIVVKDTIDLEFLRGRRLAVDGNGELYQFLALIRQRDGPPLHDDAGRITSHLSKKHQLLVTFEDDSAISCTVQMWGALACFGENEKSGIPDYLSSREKPSPLSEKFDRAYFDRLFDENTGKLSAKAFLATEQRIPGLGNGVLQDILWTAKIHPRKKMADLSSKEISQIGTGQLNPYCKKWPGRAGAIRKQTCSAARAAAGPF